MPALVPGATAFATIRARTPRPRPCPSPPLRPERSAHASIRGYLYQACLGVERWLGLEDNEALLCEGDEDLDRLVRGTGSGTSEQVKNLTGDVPLRVVRNTLRSFLWAWVTLRQRGEARDFVFTTTAHLAPRWAETGAGHPVELGRRRAPGRGRG